MAWTFTVAGFRSLPADVSEIVGGDEVAGVDVSWICRVFTISIGANGLCVPAEAVWMAPQSASNADRGEFVAATVFRGALTREPATIVVCDSELGTGHIRASRISANAGMSASLRRPIQRELLFGMIGLHPRLERRELIAE